MDSIQQAFAPGSRSNLRTQWKAYLRFTLYYSLQPVPAHISTLLRYAQCLCEGRSPLTVPSVKNYLSGVHTLHRYLSAPFPDLSEFLPSLFLKGLSKLNPHIPHQAPPITPDILLRVHGLIDFSNPTSVSIWAACLLAFFTFSRKANLFPPAQLNFDPSKHLVRGQVAICASGLLVTFTHTKTIQAGGRSIQIPITSIPGSPLCPLRAFTRMAELIPAPPHSPAFLVLEDGKFVPLTQPAFVDKLRSLLQRLQLPQDSFTGHSFRRGGASWAFASGVPGELIKLVGDWKSDAYLAYLHAPLDKKLEASRLMAEAISRLA